MTVRIPIDRAPTLVKAALPTLDADASLGMALRLIIGAGLDHLAGNQAAIGRGARVEALHQARVAVRRLRSSLALFKSWIEPEAAGEFDQALRRLGHILGAARDWDVFVDETLADALEQGVGLANVDLLRNLAMPHREAAWRAAAAALAAPAFAGLVSGLAQFVETDHWQADGAGRDLIIGSIAPKLLKKAARKVAKRAELVDFAAPESFHPLRRSIKKLRYGTDYMAGVYRHRAVRDFVHRCKALQEVLGTINDTVVTARLATELSDEAITVISGWNKERQAAALDCFLHAWRKHRAAAPFWV